MEKERMQVLKMIDEGKINVDEAAKLLDVLKTSGGKESSNLEDRFNKFSNDTKVFLKDMGKKINHIYEKAEPKVKDATKKVVAKTADIAENISQSLNDKVKDMEHKSSDE